MTDYKYIKYFPKPFLEDLVRGRVLPIIGAGFSKNALIPLGKKIPDWDELGKEFAELIINYNYNSAIDAISAYCHEYSRAKLVEKLSELLLTGQIRPGNVHKAFCNLPFESIITTNFDFLLEQGYDLVSRYCKPIIDEDQLSILNNNTKDVTLLKIHGDLHHPTRIVATEEDYDGFLNRYPMLATYLANLFISKTILFIGYSIDDPDDRQIHQLIKDRLGKLKRQAYTLRVDSNSQEITRFERRQVKVINLPRNNKPYGQVLEEVFIELRAYWTKEYSNVATITEEDSLIDFSIKKEVSDISRLCYFSVPSNNISLYKKHIFPIAELYGFAPLTADDVLSYNNSVAAKISALIERASVVVIDTSNQNTQFELSIVKNIQSKKKIKVIIISELNSTIHEGKTFHSNTADQSSNEIHITIPQNIFENINDFIIPFENAFYKIYQNFQIEFENEPSRLIEKKEYRAAVISAITLLEIQLRGMIEKKLDTKYKTESLKSLAEHALKFQFIDQKYFFELNNWINIRNRLVHTELRIDPREAKQIITSITNIMNQLKGLDGSQV